MPRARPSSVELARADVGREADHPVVGGVDLQQQRRVGGDRLGVIAQVRAIGGPHLAQYGPAAPHDVRDAELAADLDQLAARDDDFLAVRQRLERQQHGGGVVVDDQRVLGAGEPAQQRLHMAVARAALLGGDVHLEVRVRGADRQHPLQRQRAQQRAPQVGVQHHAGGVDDRSEREQSRLLDLPHHASGEHLEVRGRATVLARATALGVDDVANHHRQAGARDPGDLGPLGQGAEQLIDRRQAS